LRAPARANFTAFDAAVGRMASCVIGEVDPLPALMAVGCSSAIVAIAGLIAADTAALWPINIAIRLT
jgi:hypothetical protein